MAPRQGCMEDQNFSGMTYHPSMWGHLTDGKVEAETVIQGAISARSIVQLANTFRMAFP